MGFIPPQGEPDLQKVRGYLVNSGMQTKNPALFQAIDVLVQWLQNFQARVLAAITGSSSGKIAVIKHGEFYIDNTTIKTLPTVGYQIIPDFGLGSRIKIVGATVRAHIEDAYSNIDATYAELKLVTASFGVPLVTPLVNDSTVSPPIANVTDFFSITGYDLIHDFLIPAVYDYGGGYIRPWYGSPTASGIDAYSGVGVKVLMENGGVDLLGGGANNLLKVTVDWIEEPL